MKEKNKGSRKSSSNQKKSKGANSTSVPPGDFKSSEKITFNILESYTLEKERAKIIADLADQKVVDMAETSDWRRQLTDEKRRVDAGKIFDRFRACVTSWDTEELRNLAERYEEKVYAAARSMDNYRNMISNTLGSTEFAIQCFVNGIQRRNQPVNQLQQMSQDRIMRRTAPENVDQDITLQRLQQQGRQTPVEHTRSVMVHGKVLPSQYVNMAHISDWRTQLTDEERCIVVGNIFAKIKAWAPNSLEELKNMAAIHEAQVYAAATSKKDYLTKISSKLKSELNQGFDNNAQQQQQPTQSYSWPLQQQAGVGTERATPQSYVNGSQTESDAFHTSDIRNGERSMAESSDWRTQMKHEHRREVIDNLFVKFRACVPDLATEELRKLAKSYEAKVYAAATSMGNYQNNIYSKLEMTAESAVKSFLHAYMNSLQQLGQPVNQLQQMQPPQSQMHPNNVPDPPETLHQQGEQTSAVSSSSSAENSEPQAKNNTTTHPQSNAMSTSNTLNQNQVRSLSLDSVTSRRSVLIDENPGPRPSSRAGLLQEMEEVNERLVETIAEICDQDIRLTNTDAAAECSQATIVKLSYISNLKMHHPLTQLLLIPESYPHCSPILMDESPVDQSEGSADLSFKTRFRCNMCASLLSDPISLKKLATEWDGCARAVIFLFT